jgi:hypothetical protein
MERMEKPSDPRTLKSLKVIPDYWSQSLAALSEGDPRRLKELLKNPADLEKYLNDQVDRAVQLEREVQGRSPNIPEDQLQEVVNSQIFSPVNKEYDQEDDPVLDKELQAFEAMVQDWYNPPT